MQLPSLGRILALAALAASLATRCTDVIVQQNADGTIAGVASGPDVPPVEIDEDGIHERHAHSGTGRTDLSSHPAASHADAPSGIVYKLPGCASGNRRLAAGRSRALGRRGASSRARLQHGRLVCGRTGRVEPRQVRLARPHDRRPRGVEEVLRRPARMGVHGEKRARPPLHRRADRQESGGGDARAESGPRKDRLPLALVHVRDRHRGHGHEGEGGGRRRAGRTAGRGHGRTRGRAQGSAGGAVRSRPSFRGRPARPAEARRRRVLLERIPHARPGRDTRLLQWALPVRDDHDEVRGEGRLRRPEERSGARRRFPPPGLAEKRAAQLAALRPRRRPRGARGAGRGPGRSRPAVAAARAPEGARSPSWPTRRERSSLSRSSRSDARSTDHALSETTCCASWCCSSS